MVPCNLVNQGHSRMEAKAKKVTSMNFTSSCYLKHAKVFFYTQSVQSEYNNYIFNTNLSINLIYLRVYWVIFQ